jgi:hypothetical protein
MSTHGFAHGLGRCCLLGPVLVRGRFLCHVALTLPRVANLQLTLRTSSVLPSWRKQTRAADPYAVALVLAPRKPISNVATGCLRYGLAAQKLHWDTDATPTCAPHSHPMQMEYRLSCDYVFQICSRLHHHQHPNTNFTDFEAGVAVFFSHDLTKSLSHPVKDRSMAKQSSRNGVNRSSAGGARR